MRLLSSDWLDVKLPEKSEIVGLVLAWALTAVRLSSSTIIVTMYSTAIAVSRLAAQALGKFTYSFILYEYWSFVLSTA